MQDDPIEEMQNKQVKENNAERKRAMAKERSRKFRENKRLIILKHVHGGFIVFTSSVRY